MTRSKFPFRQRVLTLLVSMLLSISYLQPAQSQSSESDYRKITQPELRFVPPQPPSRGTPNGRRRGGGSRGPCKNYQALTALVPVTEKYVWGLTVAEHPTFWFLVPEAHSGKLTVEFVVQDETDNYIYKTTLKMSTTKTGVVKISVPSTTKPLEIDKSYKWTFSIYCAPERSSAYVFVQGSVQRVALYSAFQRQLEAATPMERVSLYANNGIWHEALTTLAEIRRTNPSDTKLAASWTNFLEQVELEDISSEPIVDCCNH